MKNTVPLLYADGEPATTVHRAVYTDSRYTFSDPTPERKYVRTLAAVRDFQRTFHCAPTRSQIALALGEPDPRAVTGYDAFYRKARRSNWGCTRWAALCQAGLLDHCREKGNRVVWFLTPRGADYLDQLDEA